MQMHPVGFEGHRFQIAGYCVQRIIHGRPALPARAY